MPDPNPAPQSVENLVGAARRMSETGDVNGALSAWADLRREAPDQPEAWLRPVSLLFRDNRLDEAETLLQEGLIGFPTHPGFFVEYGWAAHHRRDWPEAERRWSDVRRRFPNMAAGYLFGAWDLRDSGRLDDAAELLAAAAEKFPDDPSVHVERAWMENRRHRWDAALRHWELVRRKFPEHGAGYLGGAEAYRALRRFDEAEAIIAQGRARFPLDRGIAFTWADLAMWRGAWTEAASRWLTLRRSFPNDVHCSVQAYRAMAAAGEHDRADGLITKARMLAPDNYNVAFYWALAADQRGAWPVAVARWAELRVKFPNETKPYVHGMRALVEAGEPAEAQTLAGVAIAAFPKDADIIATVGDIAGRFGDLDAALVRFATAYADNRDNFAVVTRYVDALLRLDRRAEAAAVLEEAASHWPRDERLARWRIEIALRARDFDAALNIWSHVRADWGEDQGFPSDMALFILGALPTGHALETLLDFLSLPTDTGDRMWLPAFANLGDFFLQQGRVLRAEVTTYVDRNEQRMTHCTRLLWKALISAPFTEKEIEEAFERYLSPGRLAIISTLFGYFAYHQDPSSKQRTFAAFERFIARKLANPDWIHEDSPLELLSYLMFAAVASFDAYRQLACAGVQRLAFKSVSANAVPGTAATALASLLRSVAPMVTAADTAKPTVVISRLSRPLNVAICVSGQLRGFERALPTWDRLGLRDHKISTFVHTWKDTGRNWTRTWWFLRDYSALYQAVAAENGVDFLRKRFPKLGAAVVAATAGGLDITAGALKSFYQTDDVVVEDDKISALRDKPNVWKMHYKIEQAHALATTKMPEDTLYIKIRPDLGFAECGAIDWEHIYFESARDRMLYADIPYVFVGKPGFLKLADAFLIGAKEPMTAFASVYSTQLALMARNSTFFDAPPSLSSHTSVAFSTFYRGISAKTLGAARTNGFLEATILPPAQVLELLRQDVGENPKDQLEQDFLRACEKVAA